MRRLPFGHHFTYQTIETPLAARATPSELFSSGQSETVVRTRFHHLNTLSYRMIGHIAWISETLGATTKLAPAGLEISIQIYLTGDSESVTWQSDDVSAAESGKGICESEVKSGLQSLFEDPAVQIISGSRPNLKYILQTEADLTVGGMGVTGSRCRLSIESPPVADPKTNIQHVGLRLSLLR